MTSTVEVPLWAAMAIAALAGLWTLQHFLLPSARWYFRRRASHVIDEVNHRLALQLPSFKLTRREVLIDRLSFHPRVIEQVDKLANEQDTPREELVNRVALYAREIVPAFNALVYFKAAYWVARRLVHGLYRVRLGYADDAALSRLGADSSVVFMMNHRSNMDYVLATYLAAERTALSYAVGEWARVWPLQHLIRAMGGYFVRRDSSDPLYRRVLECYVQMAAEGGVPQAIFPEGRLSRNGHLQPPKLGLLGYLTRSFDPHGTRDIVFIPVGINYDRVLEDRTLLRDAERLPRRALAPTVGIFTAFLAKNLWQALIGKRFRNGYACVNFGAPVSLRQWMAEHHTIDEPMSDASSLAEDLMQRVGRITPILPVALVTSLFTDQPDAEFSEMELNRAVLECIERFEAEGHRVFVPRGDRHYAVIVGLRMLTLRRLLLEQDGVIRANPDEWPLLNYYANSIAHLRR